MNKKVIIVFGVGILGTLSAIVLAKKYKNTVESHFDEFGEDEFKYTVDFDTEFKEDFDTEFKEDSDTEFKEDSDTQAKFIQSLNSELKLDYMNTEFDEKFDTKENTQDIYKVDNYINDEPKEEVIKIKLSTQEDINTPEK